MRHAGRRRMHLPTTSMRMARGIVGFKLAIARLEAKVKMSQNREERDRVGVVQGLGERAAGDDAAIAALVDKAKG